MVLAKICSTDGPVCYTYKPPCVRWKETECVPKKVLSICIHCVYSRDPVWKLTAILITHHFGSFKHCNFKNTIFKILDESSCDPPTKERI